jgi:hypothetical protein
MFIGHYAVGFAGKSVAPKVSLGWLLLAAMFIDLLWPTLLLLGLERVRLASSETAVMPLIFEHYPISHSLLAVVGWAVLVAGLYLLMRRDRLGAVVLGVLVLGHWGLDALVHKPDLPLFPGSTTLIGLNGWSSLPLTLAIEVPLFVFGVWLYARTTTALDAHGRWGFFALVLFLLAVYAGSLFGPLPPNADAVAWAAQLQWLVILWGLWIDKHRSVSARI